MIRLCHAFGGGSVEGRHRTRRGKADTAHQRSAQHDRRGSIERCETRRWRALEGQTPCRDRQERLHEDGLPPGPHPQRCTGGHERLQEGPRLPCRHAGAAHVPAGAQAARDVHAASVPRATTAVAVSHAKRIGVHGGGAGVEPRTSREGDGDLQECEGRERGLQHVRPGDAPTASPPQAPASADSRASARTCCVIRRSKGVPSCHAHRVPFHGPAVDEGIHDEAQCRRGVTRATRVRRRLEDPGVTQWPSPAQDVPAPDGAPRERCRPAVGWSSTPVARASTPVRRARR